jgi:hypothetical protein
LPRRLDRSEHRLTYPAGDGAIHRRTDRYGTYQKIGKRQVIEIRTPMDIPHLGRSRLQHAGKRGTLADR